MARRIGIPSRPASHLEVGSCMGCDRYHPPPGTLRIVPHEVYPVALSLNIGLRLCRACLEDLARQLDDLGIHPG